jgi:hypothetical protein
VTETSEGAAAGGRQLVRTPFGSLRWSDDGSGVGGQY